MPNPTETAPSGAPSDIDARLPLARIAADGRAAETSSQRVAWGGPLSRLSAVITDAVAARFGVTIESTDTGADPRDRPAFAALYASTRTEQVVLELSSRTNLVLAGASAVIVGDGPLAGRLIRSLARIGVRVTRATDDPLTALDAHLSGLATVPTSDAGRTGAHYVLLTGENTPPRAAEHLAGVVVDASPDGTGLEIGAAVDAVRAGVRIDGDARIVGIDEPLPTGIRGGSGLQWRILDALVALSILTARGESDLALARIAREHSA